MLRFCSSFSCRNLVVKIESFNNKWLIEPNVQYIGLVFQIQIAVDIFLKRRHRVVVR